MMLVRFSHALKIWNLSIPAFSRSVSERSVMTSQLTVIAGPEAGRSFSVEEGQTLVIGRGRTSDTQMNDPTMSRVHCHVELDGGKAWLVDHGSSSGTRIRGRQITRHELQRGEVFEVGGTQIQYQRDENEPLPNEADTLPPGDRARSSGLLLPTSDLLEGACFGDYQLLEEISHGGMGVVFKARQISRDRIVAVKLIRAGQLASEAERVRFRREAEAAAQLVHPDIVPVFEIGEHQGHLYFSMEYVEGHDLKYELAAGPMEPRRAAELIRRVCGVVQYAHQLGVIHRDLKPSNILLNKRGEPRITDFGLAKHFAAGRGLTSTGEILGTPSYMPPEQVSGKLDAMGPGSDVYALGAVLYELLSGQPPFRCRSPLDTLIQVLDCVPAEPRSLNPGIPADLETICLKCLRKNPCQRYPTAAALADDLQRFLSGTPIHARRDDGTAGPSELLVRRDLEKAKEIQEAFLSQIVPRLDGWDVAAECRPVSAIAGDFYDLFETTFDRVVMAQADVSVMGIGASLISAGLHGVIRSRAEHMANNLSDWLQELNQAVVRFTPDATFVTMFLGVLDRSTGRLRFVNAGHPRPILLNHKDGVVSRLEQAAAVLGIMPRVECEEGEAQLGAEHSLVVFTNGVTGTRNQSGELFREFHLIGALQKTCRQPASAMLAGVFDALDTFSAGTEQTDDAELMIVQRPV
ncbi:MAG: SpoIIE family protein phosphatase [Pirellulaceae bacterium]